MFTDTPCARPVEWNKVDGDELYEGPEFIDRGIKLLWTPKSFKIGLSSDAGMEILTRKELLNLRTYIDQAIRAHDKLVF